MIEKEKFKKILKIFYLTRKPVLEVFGGEYRSNFKGQGIEFSDVREYLPGDDIRAINWKLTAKYSKPFIKKFEETRELSIIVLVDLSPSMSFGTKKSKRDLSAEITAIISWAAVLNNDKIGLLIFTDKVEKFIPPKKGMKQITRLIREVITFEEKGGNTSLSDALSYLLRIIKKRVVLFILSDFLYEDDYQKILKVVSKKHDVIPIQIIDPWEEGINFKASLLLRDSEDGNLILLSKRDIKKINTKLQKILLRGFEIFKKSGIEHLKLYTSKSYLKDLFYFFRKRIRRR